LLAPHAEDDEEEETSITKRRAATLSSVSYEVTKKATDDGSRRNKNAFRIPLISNIPRLHFNTPFKFPGRQRTRRPQNSNNNSQKKKKRKFHDIVIGFRGTDSSVNVKLDLKISRVVVEPDWWYGAELDTKLTDSAEWKKCVRKKVLKARATNSSNRNPLQIPTMKIHSGFYLAFREILNGLLKTIVSTYHGVYNKKKRKIPRFYVTGHSLGGALAQLCALYLHVLFGNRSPVVVYVYGCPRVGDKVFSDFVSLKLKQLYRVVFRGDVVTTIPRGFAYYKHAGWEIIVDKHGNMINNPSKREKALLPSRTSLKDHSLQKYVDSLNLIASKYKLGHLMLEIPPVHF